MVKKLFKHEFHAMWRSMTPMWVVLLGLSLMGRLIHLFETDNLIYDIVSSSSVFFYVVALIACVASPLIFAVIRFYRNMFSGEGYLTFTLPVTTSQHLWVKLTVAVATELVTLVAVALSVIVVTFGDLTVEIGKAIWYLFKMSVEQWGAHFPLYAVEAVVAVLVLVTVEILLFYCCICIGQQVSKHRVLGAVGAYFGIYAIGQVLATIAMIMATFVEMEPLVTWVFEHPFATIHIVLCGGIVLYAACGALYFAVSHWLMTRRLNLE